MMSVSAEQELDAGLLDMLHRGIDQLGLSLSDAQLDTIVLYLHQVEKWRTRMNLVSLRERRELISHHALDSLALLPYLGAVWQVLDIGTGAGFPGMLLAVARPEACFHLLDSRQRRIEFLRMVQARTRLQNVVLHCARVEALPALYETTDFPQLGVQWPVKFDTLIARAVASLEDLVKMTQPLRTPGQRLLAMKGQYPGEELDAMGRKYSETISAVQVEKLEVPFLNAQRHVVIISF